MIPLLCAGFDCSMLLENHEKPDPNGLKDDYETVTT